VGNRFAWYVLALLVAGGAVALFWVQNSARTTQLSFDLGFAAWQLQQPVPVPALIAVCVGIGAGLAGVPLMARSWRLSGRITELEQRLAVADLERSQTAASSPKEPGTW
jgi:hypothetical protein